MASSQAWSVADLQPWSFHNSQWCNTFIWPWIIMDYWTIVKKMHVFLVSLFLDFCGNVMTLTVKISLVSSTRLPPKCRPLSTPLHRSYDSTWPYYAVISRTSWSTSLCRDWIIPTRLQWLLNYWVSARNLTTLSMYFFIPFSTCNCTFQTWFVERDIIVVMFEILKFLSRWYKAW